MDYFFAPKGAAREKQNELVSRYIEMLVTDYCRELSARHQSLEIKTLLETHSTRSIQVRFDAFDPEEDENVTWSGSYYIQFDNNDIVQCFPLERLASA